MNSKPSILKGDILSCQKELAALVKAKKEVSGELVEQISSMIMTFAHDSFIPVEYSEKLLTGIGNFMEIHSEVEKSYVAFAKSSHFIEALIGIVNAFECRLTLGQSQTTNTSSFASHCCYELTVFMLLGLLDKTQILRVFVRSVSIDMLHSLLTAIGTVIGHDYLYLTQEVGLEIICRLCHFFVQQDPAGFDTITADLPPTVQEAVSDASTIPSLLIDMRPLLNEMNKNNPNVFSFAAQNFRIATTWKKVDTERTLDAEGYLDLCRDCVCYNLLDEEVLVRFTYQTIQRVHFVSQTNSIQIVLHSCPKKLRQLLKKEELPPADRCPSLIVQFPKHSAALSELKSVLEMRMIEHESIKLLDNHKYSVVSSKDQSPEAVSVALARLKQLEGRPISAVPKVSPHSSSAHMPPPAAAVAGTGRKNAKGQSKGKQGMAQELEQQHDDSPSSISSPDMDVTDTSQEHLPKHKPAPDTLVQMATSATAGSAIDKNSNTAAGNKAKTAGNAGRGRGAGAVDSLSHLRPPPINTITVATTTTTKGRPSKKTASTAAASVSTSAPKQTAARINSTKKNTSTSKNKQPGFTIYEDNPIPTTNTNIDANNNDYTMDNFDDNMGGAGDNFGFDDVYPETSHMYTPPPTTLATTTTAADKNSMAKKGSDILQNTTPIDTVRNKTSAFAASIAKTIASTTEAENINATNTSSKKRAPANKNKALQPVSKSDLNTRAGGANTEPFDSPVADHTTPVPVKKTQKGRAAATTTNANTAKAAAFSNSDRANKPAIDSPIPSNFNTNDINNDTTTPAALNLSQHSNHTTTSSSNKRKFGRAFHPQPVPLLPLDSAARSVVSAVDWMSINDDSSSSAEECAGNKKAKKNRAVAVKEKENQQQQAKVPRGKPPLASSATKMKPLTTTTTTTNSTAKKRGGRPPLATTTTSSRAASPASSRSILAATHTTANTIQHATTGPGFTIYDDNKRHSGASVAGSVAGSTAGATVGVRRSSFAMSLDLIHGKKPTTTATTTATTAAAVTTTSSTNHTSTTQSAKAEMKPKDSASGASTNMSSSRIPPKESISKHKSPTVVEDDGDMNENYGADYGMDYGDYGDTSGMYADTSNDNGGMDDSQHHLAAYHDTSFAYEAAQASPLRDAATAVPTLPTLPTASNATSGATDTANKHTWRPLSTVNTTTTTKATVTEQSKEVTIDAHAPAATSGGVSLMMQQLQATRAELSNNYKSIPTTTTSATTSHIPIDTTATADADADALPPLQVPTFSQMLQGSSQPNSQSSSVGDNRDSNNYNNTDSAVGEKHHLLDVSGPLSKRTRSSSSSNNNKETAYNTNLNKHSKKATSTTASSRSNKGTTKYARSHYGSDSDDAHSVQSNTRSSNRDQLDQLLQSVGKQNSNKNDTNDSSESSQEGDSNSNSSLEENEVVAALLAEIVKMQKERASRKRSRMLASVGETARAQVGSFLQQWRTFTDQHCAEHQRTTNAALESLCGRADALCSTLGQECEEVTKRDAHRVKDLQGLEKETVALRSEISTLLSQYKNEDASVRTELQSLSNRTLDTARKTMSMHRDTKQHASKNQKEELLKALQAM